MAFAPPALALYRPDSYERKLDGNNKPELYTEQHDVRTPVRFFGPDWYNIGTTEMTKVKRSQLTTIVITNYSPNWYGGFRFPLAYLEKRDIYNSRLFNPAWYQGSEAVVTEFLGPGPGGGSYTWLALVEYNPEWYYGVMREVFIIEDLEVIDALTKLTYICPVPDEEIPPNEDELEQPLPTFYIEEEV